MVVTKVLKNQINIKKYIIELLKKIMLINI
jgi:hypothetical protein